MFTSMKKKMALPFASLLILMSFSGVVAAQKADTIPVKYYKVVKNDGVIFVGKMISMDSREILIETKNIGQVAIPKHEIKEIAEIKETDISPAGEFIPVEMFSTRYFITTNGLPIEKGESYILWNLYGPDFQISVAKNLSLGIMTSWVGMPIIGTAKYCFPIDEKVNIAAGALIGTGSWAKPDLAIALPYASITFGDRRKNITFSGGYGAVFYDQVSTNPIPPYNEVTEFVKEGRALMSVAGMMKAGKKISIVFDSFIVTPGKYKTSYEYQYDPGTGMSYTVPVKKRQPGIALLFPGLRWQMEADKAFQFGFAGMAYDGAVVPFPMPMIQWFRKL